MVLCEEREELDGELLSTSAGVRCRGGVVSCRGREVVRGGVGRVIAGVFALGLFEDVVLEDIAGDLGRSVYRY